MYKTETIQILLTKDNSKGSSTYGEALNFWEFQIPIQGKFESEIVSIEFDSGSTTSQLLALDFQQFKLENPQSQLVMFSVYNINNTMADKVIKKRSIELTGNINIRLRDILHDTGLNTSILAGLNYCLITLNLKQFN